jgi:hypothetical protein
MLCSSPDSTIRVIDPASQECTSYGTQDRKAVLNQISPPGTRP